MNNTLLNLKTRFITWKAIRNERKYLINHLVKPDGRIDKTALKHLYDDYLMHHQFSTFGDIKPYDFSVKKSRVDIFNMTISSYAYGSNIKVKIYARMHKPMSSVPDPAIEVQVEKYKTLDSRVKVSDVSYEFMNSISPSTVLNPSGGTSASYEEVQNILSTIRPVFKWVIEDIIDWRS